MRPSNFIVTVEPTLQSHNAGLIRQKASARMSAAQSWPVLLGNLRERYVMESPPVRFHRCHGVGENKCSRQLMFGGLACPRISCCMRWLTGRPARFDKNNRVMRCGGLVSTALITCGRILIATLSKRNILNFYRTIVLR